ncbi:MAG TPA: glycolate oxidase subunit GlcF [Burkholderiales bacterium]|jgi:glycolate oxidase iron-sulfur subunit|nr:glycolate oxidase subunit GlcF [Burkholderiales bacterium]
MQTNLADFIRDTPEGREADAILRKCVHCGFCTATCPTYQLLGDELDGPRGRIYLIKQVLEGTPATAKTQLHLDRCLTCRACETTCPSGVRYGRLVDIGRNVVERQVGRPPAEALKRQALRATVPHATLFGSLHKIGQLARPLLPGNLRRKLGDVAPASPWPPERHSRRMLVLDGCVQPSFSPNTNAAAARVLDRIGISLVRAPNAGCCGAVSYHLTAQEEGLDYMRRNIDAWWPYIEQGVEAIVMTASGCGVTVKEYGELLAHDPAYADKAARVSELTRDISEVIADEKEKLPRRSELRNPFRKVAFHPPCTLQHGLKMPGKVEALLAELGFELTPVPDAHLCCGSAGTYSLLQPELSQRLLANKIAALSSGSPQSILTANIGCQTHLQGATGLPVRHWIEAVDQLTTS